MTLKTIVRGKVSGKVVKSNQPINFLGSVDKKTGEVAWKFNTLGKIESSPVIAKNKVFITSNDGRIYLLDLEKFFSQTNFIKVLNKKNLSIINLYINF